MNLPNKLSVLRILLIPVFMFFFLADFVPYGKLLATIVLIAAAFTDFLDGYIARKYNLVTDLGKLLDPIADKSFSLTALLLLVVYGIVPSPYGVIIFVIFIIRDFTVSGLRQIAASKQIVIGADKWGKIKSIVFDVSLPILFLVAFFAYDLNMQIVGMYYVLKMVGLTLLVMSTILTAYSGINYVLKNKRVLK